MSGAATFFTTLFGDMDSGFVSVSIKPVDGDWQDDYAVVALADLDGLAERVDDADQSANLYVTVCPRSTATRGTAANTESVAALWVELDSVESSTGKREYPDSYFGDLDEATTFVSSSTQWRPALIVDSGHGWHFYWKLAEPVTDGCDELLAVWRGFWEAKAEDAGKRLDPVFDSARVMRVPGSWNMKNSPVRVTILDSDPATRYDASEILDSIPAELRRRASTYAQALADSGQVAEWVAARSNGWNDQGREYVGDLVRVMQDAPERHPTLTRLLASLLQDGRSGVDLREALEALRVEFDRRVAGEHRPIGEFEDLVTWVVSQRLAEPVPSGEVILTQPPPPAALEHTEPAFSAGRVQAYRADDLREWAEHPVEFRIAGAVVRGTYGVVAGPKKALKSTLVSGEMALSLANGIPWLDSELLRVNRGASVIVVINEAVRPHMRSLFRMAKSRGLDRIGDITVIPATGVTVGDQDLETVIRQKAVETEDLVIIYDATYGFVGSDTKAESLFAMQESLFAVVQNLGAGLEADVWLVHHYKKRTKGLPDLDDLSWSGFGEWADSWLLLCHREPPRAQEGKFRLGLVAGSRQWGEAYYEIDADLGVISGRGVYSHPPQFRVDRCNTDRAAAWGKKTQANRDALDKKRAAAIMKLLDDKPYELTKTAILDSISGGTKGKRLAWDQLHETGRIASAKVKLPGSNGRMTTQTTWARIGIEPPE